MHTDVAEFYRKFVSSDNAQKIGAGNSATAITSRGRKFAAGY